MLALSSQHETVAALRSLLDSGVASRPAFPSGVDSLFPNGFQRGTLIEYLADYGSGADTLAVLAAREACRGGQTLIVVDRERRFYPPALAVSGADMANTVFIRLRTSKDQLWALNQALSCRGVGAVLCWPDKLDPRGFRALQLAAEQGGAVGLLIRPTGVRGHPTWAETQLLVETLPGNKLRRLRIEVLRSRNGTREMSAIVDLDDETGTLQTCASSVAAELAIATAAACSPGA